jgi:acetyl esterase/lipase
MKIRPLLLLMVACLGFSRAFPNEPVLIPLWADGPPGFVERKDEPERAESYWVRNIHNPTLTAFLPDKETATGAAVVICPGGGHRELVFRAEGVEAAQHLQKLGVAAFVLKYRLGREEGSPYQIQTHARQDGERAVRLVRSRAADWGINPERIGMLGFSAGGEVVSLVSHGDSAGKSDASDTVDRVSARPDFIVMIYPGPIGIPDEISSGAPPAFLLVANDDRGASGSIVRLLQRYREARVPVEAHILAQGGHGFNMGNRSKLVTVRGWPDRLTDWLVDNEWARPVAMAASESAVTDAATDLAAMEERFKTMLTRATLVGRWTGIRDGGLTAEKEDRYQIQGVVRAGPGQWIVHARIQYGQRDFVAPIPVRVEFAGGTAVMIVDNVGVPGGNKYSARVLFHEDTYAGTWSGGTQGGLMSGLIERSQE